MRVVLHAPASTAVVVVAGLPGADKSTLVAAEPRALDGDEPWTSITRLQRRVPTPRVLVRPPVPSGHTRHAIIRA